jgi:hypothetical protein
VSRGIAINARQAVDFLLFTQVMISANINFFYESFDYFIALLL